LKTFLSLLIGLIVHFSFAQDRYLQVDYIEKFGLNTSQGAMHYPTSLFIGLDSAQLYRVNTADAQFIERSQSADFTQLEFYTPSSKKYLDYYKDTKDSSVTYRWYIERSRVVVKDWPRFEWEHIDETKEVLGYTCKKAVLNFRGRKYTAYYTEELKAEGGPWKFSSLPGLILEINSENGEFEINASAVTFLEREESLIINPYTEAEQISWSEYKKRYTEKYKEGKKPEEDMLTGMTTTISMPVRNRELMVEKKDQ